MALVYKVDNKQAEDAANPRNPIGKRDMNHSIIWRILRWTSMGRNDSCIEKYPIGNSELVDTKMRGQVAARHCQLTLTSAPAVYTVAAALCLPIERRDRSNGKLHTRLTSYRAGSDMVVVCLRSRDCDTAVNAVTSIHRSFPLLLVLGVLVCSVAMKRARDSIQDSSPTQPRTRARACNTCRRQKSR